MTTASSARLPVPAPGRYRLDAGRSRIAFTTRHLFGLAGVRGTFALDEGDLTVTEQPERSTVDVRAGTASFSTGDRRRDSLVVGPRFLDAQAHPVMSYRSTALTRTADGTWTVTGELDVAGRTAPLELAVTSVTQDGDELHVEATGTVDRYAHGLTRARGLAARRLQVTLTAHARR